MPVKIEERERMGRIEKMVENLEKSLDEFKADTKDDLKTLHQKIDSFIDSSNKTYATKKELYFLIPICALALVGFLVVNKIV